jgi:CheY-like chemotaxis protein
VCQLHGGDVGVSSKDGEGSTFGFFFKVRRSDGTSNSGRPPFGTQRTTSDNSNPATQAQNSKRPPYTRSTSTLENIKEYKVRPKGPTDADSELEHHPDVDPEEVRTKSETRTTHSDVDSDGTNSSIANPPVESHNASSRHAIPDERTRQTQPIAEQVIQDQSSLASSPNRDLPDLLSGETVRQKDTAKARSTVQNGRDTKAQDTLLLVEDNLINQKVLRRQLQSRGFEVFVANNGQEAVDMVETRGKVHEIKSTRRNRFDCILMDQEMPVMDGNTATEEIRELQRQGRADDCPILGVTANVREAQTRSMLESGMDAVISKPFKVDDLVKKIRSLLSAPSPVPKGKEKDTMDDKEQAKAQLPPPEIRLSEPETQQHKPKIEEENTDSVQRTDALDQEKSVVKEEKLASMHAKQRTNQLKQDMGHENQGTQQHQSKTQSATPKTQQLYKESKQDKDKARREAGQPQHSSTRNQEQSDDR